jgi:hypothetical protein
MYHAFAPGKGATLNGGSSIRQVADNAQQRDNRSARLNLRLKAEAAGTFSQIAT